MHFMWGIARIGPVRGTIGWIESGRRGVAQVVGAGFRAPLIWQTLALSGLLNVLQLSASLYMLRIYDHVLPLGSLAMLGVLTGVVFVVHVVFALLDMLRSRLLFKAGVCFMQRLDAQALRAIQEGAPRRGLAAIHDVERVGRFLTNAGPSAFFDILWAPVFLVAVSLLHPALGCFAGAGLLLVGCVGVVAEVRTREAVREISRRQHLRFALARDAEAANVSCNGRQGEDLLVRWDALARSYYDLRSGSAYRAMRFAALAKGLRLMLQSGGLALGALLVIEGAMSAGGLVASSIIMGRMFASLDAALAHWRCFVAAKTSYDRLAHGSRAVA
jgi:ABC-type protease/lipase transport system fused ATPase/permease subunit